MDFPDLDFNLNNLELFDTNNTSRTLFNFSVEEAYAIINKEHKILDAYFLKALVAIYVILMVTGLFSNTMVWLVVARRAQMRTPRNFYVVNLTVSDISLCLISMPFTLVNFIDTQWHLGIVMCKLVPVIQGCNIFVSTGTVMAIALDRYFTVCRSSGAPQDKYRVLLSIALIWIISCLLAFPILLYQVLEEENIGGLLVIRRCIEKWPSSSMRVSYTFGLLVFQLVIPILVLAGVHVAIANHLKAHTVANDRSSKKNKSLLKKSFFRGGGSEKKNLNVNVFHMRLDESTVITTDEPTKIMGNGGESTLYNIPVNSQDKSAMYQMPQGSGQPKNSLVAIPSPTSTKTSKDKIEGSTHHRLNGQTNGGDGSMVVVVDGANPRRSPLNVKFKSNIGVCITFREFCQLSTTGGGKNSASASVSGERLTPASNLIPDHKKKEEIEGGEGLGTREKGKESEGNIDIACVDTLIIPDIERTQPQQDEGQNIINDEQHGLSLNGSDSPSPNCTSSRANSGSGMEMLVKSQVSPSPPPPQSMVQSTMPIHSSVLKRTKKELARNRRTTIILLSVAVIFTVSWMPWHLLTLWADLHPNFTSTSNLYMFFAIAHILAMTSAVTNAILYGWFNTNLRRELLQMLSSWIKR